MNELLPIIAQLADAKTHVERAEWLLSCPIAILRKFDGTIRNRLMHAGCDGAFHYLDALGVALSATRNPDTGMLFGHADEILFLAGQRLLAWSAHRDVHDACDDCYAVASDASPTDL
ncbi:hypothetical protein [Shinella kummerowiae]|uniref:hypothetical protein n=1 Tax=Shinella kummerowiae TaxID=417745 RepID=UPI0021B6A1BD|nr:hypothetical protein [Shinella kummerowiae]MCT7662347.1 hypothetical protein [Shinella kummerowiae]